MANRLKRYGADDLLFPSDSETQTRFNQMRVLMFSGASAAHRMAEFIREYTNRDGTKGLPPSHIGATSPYIDGGNLFYIYYQDNANDPFIDKDFPVNDLDGNAITFNDAKGLQAAAQADNKTLIARLQGSDTGWRN